MICITNIHRNTELLPHFMRHYRKNGVTHFILGVNETVSNETFKSLKCDHVLGVVRLISGEPTGPVDAAYMEMFRRQHVSHDEWYVVADLDEFHEVDGMSLREAACRAELDGYDAITGEFVDRLMPNGNIPRSLPDGDIFHSFPIQCHITRDIAQGQCNKVLAAKGYVPITSGHHFAPHHRGWNVGKVHHFKWFGDIKTVLERRLKQLNDKKLSWSVETERFLEHLKQNGGRFVVPETQKT